MADVTPSHVAQVAITVRDLKRAKAWYAETLGLPHLFDAPPGLAFFQCGATRLMLAEPEGPDTAGSSILYYGVPDVGAAYQTMRQAGVTFEEEPKVIARIAERDIHLAICRDSEDNLLGLISA